MIIKGYFIPSYLRIFDITKKKKVHGFQIKQRCTRCGEMFDETMNIGRWNCRQHRYAYPTMGIWPCCEGKAYQGGCIVSDHCATDGHVFTESDDMYLDIETIKEMANLGICPPDFCHFDHTHFFVGCLNKKSIVSINTTYAVIRRFPFF